KSEIEKLKALYSEVQTGGEKDQLTLDQKIKKLVDTKLAKGTPDPDELVLIKSNVSMLLRSSTPQQDKDANKDRDSGKDKDTDKNKDADKDTKKDKEDKPQDKKQDPMRDQPAGDPDAPYTRDHLVGLRDGSPEERLDAAVKIVQYAINQKPGSEKLYA